MIRLGEAREGRSVRIRNVRADEKLNKRMCDLGLYAGMKIDVVKNDHSGPIILKVLESKLMLGRDQANEITVEELR